jgi:hypothetical protein
VSANFGGFRFQYPQGTQFARYLAPASLQISQGDLLYWTGSVAQPLSAKAILGTQVLDQAAIAAGLFLGACMSGRIASQAGSVWPADSIDVVADTPYLADCASATFEEGDLVGVVRNVGNTALQDQNVVGVVNPALAIGRVIRREPVAVTSVLIQLFGKNTWQGVPNNQSMFARQGNGVTALADSNGAVDHTMGPILTMVPTAARNQTLPVEAQSKGLGFEFTNNSAGAFAVTFQSSAAGAIKGNGVVPQNKTAILWCDGTNWTGLVSA